MAALTTKPKVANFSTSKSVSLGYLNTSANNMCVCVYVKVINVILSRTLRNLFD